MTTMSDSLLSKDDEDALLQCSHFHDLLARAIYILEQDDYYCITTQLREVHDPLTKLVITARAAIYSRRLRAVSENLDKKGQ
jgi:hypothetical protein